MIALNAWCIQRWKRLTWRPATRRTNQWRKGSEIYWICSGQPVSCRLIARKLSAPQTSTACRSPETVCRIYCISPFWLPCNSSFIYKRVNKIIHIYTLYTRGVNKVISRRKAHCSTYTLKQRFHINYTRPIFFFPVAYQLSPILYTNTMLSVCPTAILVESGENAKPLTV